jgi:hypothetical protein
MIPICQSRYTAVKTSPTAAAFTPLKVFREKSKGNEPYYGNTYIGQEILEVTREVEELVDVCRGR